jgi:ribosomal protein S18 acetylase RimI-like enzyme
MPITLRQLIEADADTVAALIRTAFAAQDMATDPPSSALKETPGALLTCLARGGGGAVAELDGRIVGAIVWEEKDGGLYFGRLSVDPATRGLGVARRLVEAAEAEARRRGLPRLHLLVRVPLVSNRRFFAARGYRETGGQSHPGYADHTTMGMEKRLEAAAPGG